MLILGIETTCDETAAAVVRDGKEILSNVISSQVAIHQPYGGVWPELASRSHLDLIQPVVSEAVEGVGPVDAVAVAQGPGLAGALLVGINVARGLAMGWDLPLIGVNHIEAHLYAAMMAHDIPLPALGVVVSGGHTALLLIKSVGQYELIGATVDDAVGEAFDKVAAMLGLPYPGGPQIEQLAKHGDPNRYAFAAGQVKGKPLSFSFSGLKTNVLYAVKGQQAHRDSPLIISEEEKAHVAASFQECALRDVVEKAEKAMNKLTCRSVIVGGGVSNNQRLRQLFSHLPVYWPPAGLSLDNAAMIAGLAYHKRDQASWNIHAQPRMKLVTKGITAVT